MNLDVLSVLFHIAMWLKMPKHTRSDEAVASRKETRIAVSVDILLRCKFAGFHPPLKELPVSLIEVYDYLCRSRRGEFVECRVKKPKTEQSSREQYSYIG